METDNIPATSRALALEKRKIALAKIEAAQNLLSEACQAACPLKGWADQWKDIGDQYDAVHALWHRCNDAPLPIGYD